MAGVIEGTNTISGSFGILRNPGAPVAGTNEVQTITFGGAITGGTFRLGWMGYVTAPIAWSASNATLVANTDAALEALPPIGTNGVTTAAGTLTAGIGTETVTFDGPSVSLSGPYPVITADASGLTGTAPTVTVAQTTPGVRATHRNASIGQQLTDMTPGVGKDYINTSATLGAPVWTVVGSQS